MAVAVICSVGGILIYQLGSAFVDCVVMDHHSIYIYLLLDTLDVDR